MYKSAEARDFHKPQAIMTGIDTPTVCATEAPPRRKECPVHLTPGVVGMSSSTKRRSSHSFCRLQHVFHVFNRLIRIGHAPEDFACPSRHGHPRPLSRHSILGLCLVTLCHFSCLVPSHMPSFMQILDKTKLV